MSNLKNPYSCIGIVFQIDSRSIPHLLTKELHYELRGLKRRLKYEFWITAFTRIGEGQSTSVISLNVSTQGKLKILLINYKKQFMSCRIHHSVHLYRYSFKKF